jgi:hypothetical protein
LGEKISSSILKWIIVFLTFSDPSNHLGSYAISLIAFFIWANSNHVPLTFLWGRAAYFKISWQISFPFFGCCATVHWVLTFYQE